MGVKWYSAGRAEGAPQEMNSRRSRVLDAYTEFMDTLEEEPDAKNEEGYLLLDDDADPAQERWYNQGCCGKVVGCMRFFCAVDESMLPYKLLYIFTRGGYAAMTTFLVVYFSQIGISPTTVGRIQLVPHALTAVMTVAAGFASDAIVGSIFLLLVAVILWGSSTLATSLVKPPVFTDCAAALEQLSDIIDTSNIDRPYTRICRQGPINASAEGTHHWNSVLRLPVTRWSSELQGCYPGATFASVIKQGDNDPSQLPTYGITFTSSQQREIARGWMYGEGGLERTFYTVFLLIAAGTVMQQVILTLVDGVTLSKLGRGRRHEYGLQRSTGTAGFAVCAIVIAYILYLTEVDRYICQIPIVVQDYYPAMLLHIVAAGCSIALVLAMCVSKCKDEHQKVPFNARDILVIFNRSSFLPIVLTAFFLSVCEGLVQPYLIWHIQYIGGTMRTICWSTVAMGFTELVMAFVTGDLILQFGYSPILCVGVGVYFVRFLVYALLSNTATVYVAEILHGISIALTWNVIVAYLSGAVPRECQTFLQGVLRGLCLGLGEGFGIFIAGYFIDAQGTFNTFYLYSLFCLTGCFVLVIYQTSRAALPVSNGEAHHLADDQGGVAAAAAAAAPPPAPAALAPGDGFAFR